MSKRIGILTHHHVINDGAILQAYSLATALEKYYDRDCVEIIDYRPKRVELMYLRSIFSGKNPKAIIRKFRRYFNLKLFIKNQLPLSKRKLITDDYYKGLNFLMGRYDLIVIGSDEVWRISDMRPFPNLYWPDPALDCKKISFSASANKTDLDKLTKEKIWMKTSLEGFDLISVRDEFTLNLVKSLDIKHAKLSKVPDPTFMYKIKNTGVKKRLKKSGIDFNKPILGVLLYDKKLSAEVSRHYRAKGYQIVALSIFNQFADVNLIDKLNPFEWAEVFKYLTFCITDSLHGTIFCLKNGTPFVGVSDFRIYLKVDSKIYSFLKDLSLLSNHVNILETNYDFESFFDQADQVQKNWDSKKITAKLDQMEKECYAFIQEIGDALKSK